MPIGGTREWSLHAILPPTARSVTIEDLPASIFGTDPPFVISYQYIEVTAHAHATLGRWSDFRQAAGEHLSDSFSSIAGEHRLLRTTEERVF